MIDEHRNPPIASVRHSSPSHSPKADRCKICQYDGDNRKRVFHALDLMRGVAALAIFFRHIDLRFFRFSSMYGSACSFLAVDFFFGLSGFVLAHAYEERLKKGLSLGTFLRQRAIRLYPLALLALFFSIASLLLMPQGNSTTSLLASLGLALFFIPIPVHLAGLHYQLTMLNAPSWSICCELIANIFYATIFRFLTKPKLLTLIAVSAIAIVASMHVFGSIDVGYSLETLPGGIARVFFSFFAGVVLYRLWKKRNDHIHPPFWAGVLVLALALGLQIPWQWQNLYSSALIFAGFPALIYFSAGCDIRSRTLTSICTTFGTLSYTVYILQDPLRKLIKTLMLRFTHSNASDVTPALGVIAFIAFFGLCLMIENYYDKPVRAWLHKRFPGKQSTITNFTAKT